MALQAAVQRGPCQTRDRRLESGEAIVQREERVAAERYDHRLLLGCEDGGMNGLRPHIGACVACVLLRHFSTVVGLIP